MEPPQKVLLSPIQIVQELQAQIDGVVQTVLASRRLEGLILSPDIEAKLREQIRRETYKKLSQGVLDAYISGRYTQIEAQDLAHKE